MAELNALPLAPKVAVGWEPAQQARPFSDIISTIRCPITRPHGKGQEPMIGLREVESKDSPNLLRWRNLPEIAVNMQTDHKITQAEHDAWFSSILHNQSRKYWIITRDDRDIGLANLYDISEEHKRCYWAFYIGESSERGVGTGAFIEAVILDRVFLNMNFEKLSCEVLTRNDRIVRQHVKFGFSIEGVLREHVFKENQRLDISCLGLLRREWLERREEILKKLVARGHRYLARDNNSASALGERLPLETRPN